MTEDGRPRTNPKLPESVLCDCKMEKNCPIPIELIAPCGMDCAVCSRYLAYLNNLKRSQCPGCRPRNQVCTYLFQKCTGINHGSKADAAFCYECGQYPCQGIKRLDNRYRKNYGMSVKENLEHIQQLGMEKFIQEQYRKYRCPKCGHLISTHNRKCFRCDEITRLVEIKGKKYT